MTKVHAYLARIKDQEKEVIAVPDGAGRALCISSDKHWTLTREWRELHIIAPLVEAARWEQNYLDADTVAHHATVEAAEREDAALADRLERQAATISELQGSFLRVERERDEAWRVAGEQTRLERDRAEAAERNARDFLGERNTLLDKLQKVERERDEWQASADKWHGEWQKIAPIRDVSRADVAEALACCLNPEEWNLTFPALVNEICDLFGVEAEQAVDPVEAKAKELYGAATPDARWETVADEYRRIARHVLGQEDS